QLSSYKALFAPIRKFLDELLAAIFAFCLPSLGSASPSDVPMLLMRICFAWRQLALVTPRIW
ncbi:hypothetical protein JAAARDRAFT_112906, partial [Jaapia argillacea MUCL 33604]